VQGVCVYRALNYCPALNFYNSVKNYEIRHCLFLCSHKRIVMKIFIDCIGSIICIRESNTLNRNSDSEWIARWGLLSDLTLEKGNR
jgi:hypothetical protein